MLSPVPTIPSLHELKNARYHALHMYLAVRKRYYNGETGYGHHAWLRHSTVQVIRQSIIPLVNMQTKEI